MCGGVRGDVEEDQLAVRGSLASSRNESKSTLRKGLCLEDYASNEES